MTETRSRNSDISVPSLKCNLIVYSVQPVRALVLLKGKAARGVKKGDERTEARLP